MQDTSEIPKTKPNRVDAKFSYLILAPKFPQLTNISISLGTYFYAN